MSSYQNIIDNMSSSEIYLPNEGKYNEVIELYKMITIHIIISTEATVFKICSTNDLKLNLNSIEIYEHISVFVQKILLEIIAKTTPTDIDSHILKISKITEHDQECIYDKVFFLIYNFYSNFNRSKLNTDNYEKYKKHVVKKVLIFFKNNISELVDVLKEEDYRWEGDYNLNNLEFYYEEDEED